MIHTFNAPAAVVVGKGASRDLLTYVQRLGADSVLFVTDAFMASTGLIEQLAQPLRDRQIRVSVFQDVQPDPTVQNVLNGLQALHDANAGLLVAVGGGSPLDAAKAIAMLATNPQPLSQYAGYHQVKQAGLPVVAIPTTAGTGSEVTKVAVITDTERDVKMMMFDAHLMPTVALVDYELTMSMPPALTAHVGVDTLTHGIEAYVSRKANGLTDPIALSCIGLVAQHLPTAWTNPTDEMARAGMALAACQGGMAFTNSSVCLVHGMSRPLGVQFHLPHGLSNAVLLPTVTRFSVAGAPSRYAQVARTMGLVTASESDDRACQQLIQGLDLLNQQLAIPRLRDCRGMTTARFEQVLDKMATDALASGSPQNNPVVPTPDEIIRLYREAW